MYKITKIKIKFQFSRQKSVFCSCSQVLKLCSGYLPTFFTQTWEDRAYSRAWEVRHLLHQTEHKIIHMQTPLLISRYSATLVLSFLYHIPIDIWPNKPLHSLLQNSSLSRQMVVLWHTSPTTKFSSAIHLYRRQIKGRKKEVES